jgi:hypothetical protein
MPLRQGLAAQVAWQQAVMETEAAARLLVLPQRSAQQLAGLQPISA